MRKVKSFKNVNKSGITNNKKIYNNMQILKFQNKEIPINQILTKKIKKTVI